MGGLRRAIRRTRNILKVKTSVETRLDKIEKNHGSEVANLKTEIFSLEKVVSNLKEAFRKELSDRDGFQFMVFRGNLLMDLMRKLLPDEARKAAHKNTNPRWSTFAENFKEADFKNATKDFNVSKEKIDQQSTGAGGVSTGAGGVSAGAGGASTGAGGLSAGAG